MMDKDVVIEELMSLLTRTRIQVEEMSDEIMSVKDSLSAEEETLVELLEMVSYDKLLHDFDQASKQIEEMAESLDVAFNDLARAQDE